MSGRIKLMRQKLYAELVRLETPGDWGHIVKQSGMFGYTGISPKQIVFLQGKFTFGYFMGRYVFEDFANVGNREISYLHGGYQSDFNCGPE
jgi:aspartate/tyrosine/aromatic aminotransferase